MAAVEDRDLTGEDGTGALDPAALVPPGPAFEPFNIAKEQEKVRGVIAQALIVLLAVIILFAFISLWTFSSGFPDLEKLMTIVFGPVIALVGTAIGYYFGGKTTQNGQQNNG
jgi:hypothetical protein